jgi:hypothetical protein
MILGLISSQFEMVVSVRIYQDSSCMKRVEKALSLASAGDYDGCRSLIDEGLKYIKERPGEPIDPTEFLSVIVDGIRKFHPMEDVHSIATGEKALDDCRFCIELEQLLYLQNRSGNNLQGGYMQSHNSYLLVRWMTTIGEARYSEGQEEFGLEICREALWLRAYCAPNSFKGMLESIDRHANFFQEENSSSVNLDKLQKLLTKREIYWHPSCVSQLTKQLYSKGLRENGLELFNFAAEEYGADDQYVADMRAFIEQIDTVS